METVFFSQIDKLQNLPSKLINSKGKIDKNKSVEKSYSDTVSADIKVSEKGLALATANKAVETIPDVRKDLVEDVKQRLANGTYFRDDIVEIIAEKIIYGWS